MKRKYLFLILFSLLVAIGSITGQQSQILPARINNGKFILTVDLAWNKQQQQAFARQFDFDSLLLQRVMKNDFKYVNDSSNWKTKLIKPDIVELSTNLGVEPEENEETESLAEIILTELFSKGDFVPIPEKARFGTNLFRSSLAFRYKERKACFFLPGYQKARQVMISGSFNNWSTLQNSLQKTDSGWIICLPLEPGKYSYKYVVDGRWMTDPNNDIREENDQGTQNSVVFCYNQRFFLHGYSNARRVSVAGSFNNWNSDNLRMKKTGQGWALSMYLQEGTHTYKFIVDGKWMTDPDNPAVRADGNGNQNSFVGLGDSVLFLLEGHANAKEVMLTGSFNAWNERELKMTRKEHHWEIYYVLGAGNYQYKFIVDGKWIIDPINHYTIGNQDYINSFLAFKPNHVFSLNGFSEAKEVIVTGSFNSWRTDGYRMQKKSGSWIFPVYLDPGRYTYKFLVDGVWHTDPANLLYEDNQYGTANSVIWIEP